MWPPATENCQPEPTKETLKILETGLIEPGYLVGDRRAPVVSHALYRALNLDFRTSQPAGVVKVYFGLPSDGLRLIVWLFKGQ